MSKVELDNLNQYISNSLIRSQKAMIATTIINGNICLRMCTINPRTTYDDVREMVDLMEKYALNYLKEYPG
jgi:glutamate/tyrosine decarboxylase-like PLP-dependent enzyme